MSVKWTQEELKSAVIAYLDMRTKELNNIPFIKKEYYSTLSKTYGRTEKSYEYRMQNISYVLSIMGRSWVTGLKPAKNVGARVAGEIEDIINDLEGNARTNISDFITRVTSNRANNQSEPPSGNRSPEKETKPSTQYVRDAAVVAWVLELANGICECCDSPGPFEKEDGSLFLEVHHLRRLSDGGSDTPSNAVAICPNCHREMHYGINRTENLNKIYTKNNRLIKE